MRRGRASVGLSSLYVASAFRGHGIASRALTAVQNAVVGTAGADGLCLNAEWCWPRATRFYLDLGWWVANWKHSLLLVPSAELPLYRVEVRGTRAEFMVRNDTGWVPLIRARNRGTTLGWTTGVFGRVMD